MSDPMTVEQARAIVAQADANAAAERQAKEEAATTVLRALVASAEFKAGLAALEATLTAAPKVTELSYAVNMLERLRDSYAA